MRIDQTVGEESILNWEAIGAVGETLGAVGVIVTLGYLAYQLRQNTRALKLNAEFSAAQEHIHNSVNVSGTAVPDVVFRGLEDPAQLTREESAQFVFWFNGSMRMYQHQHLMFLEGNLSQASWTSTERLIKGFVQNEGWKAYWSVRRNTYSDEFQRLIDNLDTSEVVSSVDAIHAIQNKER